MSEPRYSIPAEQSVIGGLMLKNSALNKVAALITADDFYHNDHKTIFSAILELSESRQPFDFITISECLKSSGKNNTTGDWFSYLGGLARDVPSVANIVSYAEYVRNYSIMRQAVEVYINAQKKLLDPELKTAESVLLNVAAENSKLLSTLKREQSGGIIHIKDVLLNVVDNIEVMFESDGKQTGLIETGFIDFDESYGGLPEIGCVGFGGRPGQGKTTLVMNIIERFVISKKNNGKQVIVFSMDMTAEKLVMRMLSSLSRIDYSKISTGKLEDDDWARLSAAVNLLAESNLYIDGSGSLTLSTFQSKVEGFRNDVGEPAIIVIDYVQLMTVNEMQGNRTGMMGEISMRLKEFAKEWRCLIIEILQLSRNLESRPNKRPVMSDIRDSGQFEQDLEAIYFVYRDETYNEDSPDKGIAEIIGGKVRDGEPCTTRLVANLKQSRFENSANGYQAADYDNN